MIARILPFGEHEYYLTSDGRVTRFTRAELACRCGCGLADMREETIDALNDARTRFAHPMLPISGVRCAKHNAAIKGKADSAHLEGLAVDLSSNRPLWDLCEALALYFTRLWVYAASKGFFCHADMRPSHLRRVVTQDGEFGMPDFYAYYKLDAGIGRDRIQEVLEAT